MRILAFDTCFAAIDVAVLDGERIAAHLSETVTAGHGERLLPLVEQALSLSGLAFVDLDRIAVTVGPGGFTGLRVGVAVARALALSTGKPLAAMTSLELLARTAFALPEVAAARPATIVATADARKDMLFAQSFTTDPWTALEAPRLAAASDIAFEITSGNGVSSSLPRKGGGRTTEHDAMSSLGPTCIAVGAGAAAIADASQRRIRALAASLLPDARILARAARTLTSATEARPLYVRAADAKPQTGKSLPRA